ncbi:MAG: RDD family protein [Candidatus Hydrogenedentota bacterium]
MDWYYAAGREQRGPISQDEFDGLVRAGTISADTLVWHERMPDWMAYGRIATTPVPAVPPSPERVSDGATASCVECQRIFPIDDMLPFQGRYVCADCKDVFFQRVREGVALPGGLDYAGFWIRVGAYMVDYVIQLIVFFALQMVVAPILFAAGDDPGAAMAGFLLAQGFNMAVWIAYGTWFVGKFGATPGKMVCGLKIVRPDETPVTYLRAFGRIFAQMISGMIFAIGYIMAAFDAEKRALHDHMCDTRVIRVPR